MTQLPTAQIQSLDSIRTFITAGNALFTLVSKKTGDRKTFLVEQSEKREGYGKPGFFVKLLVGPENTDSYRYLGFMYEGSDGDLHIKQNREAWGTEAVKGFEWMLHKINFRSLGGPARAFEQNAEFWHAGRCGRCGRTLTVPESIASGIGPVCATRE